MIRMNITGMTCDACAAHVKAALEAVPGVRSAEVSHKAGAAVIELSLAKPGSPATGCQRVLALFRPHQPVSS